MKDFLVYLFWPNPGNAYYDSPKAMALLLFCVALVAASLVLSVWRRKQSNQVMRRLSKSWPTAAFWFGLVGLILVVARVEQIQFIAMRILWVVWGAILLVYLFFQIKLFRSRYYTVLPTETALDPRAQYLPKRKKK